MPEARSGAKLDFTSGIDKLPTRKPADATATAQSVQAAQEVGFLPVAKTLPHLVPTKIDGRKRYQEKKVQLNLKVPEAEKNTLVEEAGRAIAEKVRRKGKGEIRTVGDFVVHLLDLYMRQKSVD